MVFKYFGGSLKSFLKFKSLTLIKRTRLFSTFLLQWMILCKQVKSIGRVKHFCLIFGLQLWYLGLEAKDVIVSRLKLCLWFRVENWTSPVKVLTKSHIYKSPYQRLDLFYYIYFKSSILVIINSSYLRYRYMYME